MRDQEARRLETEALIEAIWGPQDPEPAPTSLTPAERERQNEALAAALRAYLQQYLFDAGVVSQAPGPAPT